MSKLHVNCPENLYNNIINNSPKPFPSSTKIKKFNSEKNALYGRRFETSMLCYDVRNCDCCGNICINHDDNLLLQNENHIIKRSHLSRKIHKVWKCSCSNICSGEQFYCPQKPSKINFYKLHHESKDSWKFLKLKKTPNASICDFCYKDVPENTGKYVTKVTN